MDLGIRSCLACTFDQRRPDGGRILEARVMVGDDEDVTALDRGARHVEPLARITVAVSAEEHQHLARCHAAHGGERLLERVGGVAEVDEHRRPAFPGHSWVRPGR